MGPRPACRRMFLPRARDRRVGARRLKGTVCRHAAHWNILYTTGFCNYGEVATYITFSDLDFATTGGILSLRPTYMEERGPRKVTLRLESHKLSEPKGLIIKLKSTEPYNIWLRCVSKGLIMALAFSGLLLWLHCAFRDWNLAFGQQGFSGKSAFEGLHADYSKHSTRIKRARSIFHNSFCAAHHF